MSEIQIDEQDITVSVIPNEEFVTSVTPSEIYQVDVGVDSVYNVNIQEPNVIVTNGSSSVYDLAHLAGYAFYAGTASLAATASYISGAIFETNWSGIINIPPGLVSSSTQVDYTQIQNKPVLVPSASFALTASYVAGDAGVTDWTEITNIPSGIVSSSVQVNYNQIQNQPTLIPSASYSSYAVTASYVAGDAGVTDWSEITNIPSGIVSSSSQVHLEQISGSTFADKTYTFPEKVQVQGSLTASIQTNQLLVKSNTSNVHISSSFISGIFDETRTIEPPISINEFSGVVVDYTAQRSNSIRAGSLIASWSGSSVSYTDVSATDIGDGYDISFHFIRSVDTIRLRAYSLGSGSGAWTVQFLYKLFPNLL